MAKRSRRKKKSNEAIRIGETATPERRKQLGGVTTEVVDRDSAGSATINRHKAKLECVLDYYWRTGRLNDPQHDAGMKFREIYLRANIGFAKKILGDIILVGDTHIHVENRMLEYIACLRRLDTASKELTPAQNRVLRQVCGHDEFAKSKSDRKALQRGLQSLAEFFSIVAKTK